MKLGVIEDAWRKRKLSWSWLERASRYEDIKMQEHSCGSGLSGKLEESEGVEEERERAKQRTRWLAEP